MNTVYLAGIACKVSRRWMIEGLAGFQSAQSIAGSSLLSDCQVGLSDLVRVTWTFTYGGGSSDLF